MTRELVIDMGGNYEELPVGCKSPCDRHGGAAGGSGLRTGGCSCAAKARAGSRSGACSRWPTCLGARRRPRAIRAGCASPRCRARASPCAAKAHACRGAAPTRRQRHLAFC